MLYPIFHEGVLRLYVISLSIIVIISYLEGFFDQFVKAAISIVSCAFEVIFTNIFLGWVSRTREAIAVHITDPYHAFVSRIPRGFKAMFFTLLGYSIFVLDHLYNTKLFAEDETTFYDIIIYGHKYWITDIALMYGGVILSYGLLYFFVLISEIILSITDRRVKFIMILRK